MADPVLPGAIRTLVVFQNANGLPEDRYVTTWCFELVAAWNPAVHPAAIATALTAFYNNPVGAEMNVSNWLGTQVNRATNAAKVVSYWLGETPPRAPHSVSWTVGAINPGTPLPLPAEVAVVTSFQSDKTGPRGKGRVYIGPLNVSAATPTESGDARPTAQFRTVINNAAKGLAESAVLVDAGLMWSQLSQVDAEARPVISGYTDNAFDTQRRRGLVTSSRSTWVKA